MKAYTQFIKELDHKPHYLRLDTIIHYLEDKQVAYRTQTYASGTNLIVDLGNTEKRIAIASHFDIVPGSGGANDNGSAIAVCLDIINTYTRRPLSDTGLRIFFFDEEETGLKGSAAYTRQFGVADLTGMLNLELVGRGDRFALWPLNSNSSGALLDAFEQSAKKTGIEAIRFDNIITNTADHLSFRNAGLADAFTITCISAEDIQAAGRYYAAMKRGAGTNKLREILTGAPVFAHYHQPSDTWNNIDESAILKTAGLVWEAICLK